MRHPSAWLGVAYPLTAHGLVLADLTAWIAAVLAPLALLQAIVAGKGHQWAGLTLALVVVVACGVDLATGHAYAMYLPPVIVSAFFLSLFGETLLPGREPLITRFARVLMQETDAQTQRYTRRVTWLWSGFFAAQLLENVLLALYAPVAVWSLFANVLNYLFIAALFTAELAYRVLVLRRHSTAGFFAAVRNADLGALVRSR